MIANIFRFSLFLKNGDKWLLMVAIGSICVKNTQNMGIAKLVQNNLKQIFRYLKIYEYFGQIYLFAKIFVDFF